MDWGERWRWEALQVKAQEVMRGFLAVVWPDTWWPLVTNRSEERGKTRGSKRDTRKRDQADCFRPITTVFAYLHQTKQLLPKLGAWKKTDKLVVWVTEFTPDTWFGFLLTDILHILLLNTKHVACNLLPLFSIIQYNLQLFHRAWYWGFSGCLSKPHIQYINVNNTEITVYPVSK